MQTVRVMVEGTVAINDVLVPEGGRTHIHCLCSGGIPCFCGSWSLLPGQVFLGESLLPCFGFPVVVTDPSTVLHHSAAELTKHGFGGHDGNLAGAV